MNTYSASDTSPHVRDWKDIFQRYRRTTKGGKQWGGIYRVLGRKWSIVGNRSL